MDTEGCTLMRGGSRPLLSLKRKLASQGEMLLALHNLRSKRARLRHSRSR